MTLFTLYLAEDLKMAFCSFLLIEVVFIIFYIIRKLNNKFLRKKIEKLGFVCYLNYSKYYWRNNLRLMANKQAVESSVKTEGIVD